MEKKLAKEDFNKCSDFYIAELAQQYGSNDRLNTNHEILILFGLLYCCTPKNPPSVETLYMY